MKYYIFSTLFKVFYTGDFSEGDGGADWSIDICSAKTYANNAEAELKKANLTSRLGESFLVVSESELDILEIIT